MLFRRFMLVTTSIALMGILLLNILEATHPDRDKFQIGNRALEWQRYDAIQACRADRRICALIVGEQFRA